MNYKIPHKTQYSSQLPEQSIAQQPAVCHDASITGAGSIAILPGTMLPSPGLGCWPLVVPQVGEGGGVPQDVPLWQRCQPNLTLPGLWENLKVRFTTVH